VSRASRAAIAAAVVLAAVNCLTLPDAAHSAIQCAASVAALVAIAVRLRSLRPERSALGNVLTLSMALWALGVLASTALGSPVVIFRLASEVALVPVLCIVLFHQEHRRAVFVDVAALAATLGVLAHVFLVGPYLESNDLPIAHITYLGFAATEIVLFALTLRLMMAPRPRNRAAVLVGAAVLAMMASDLLWSLLTVAGSYTQGIWADAGWVAQPLLLAAAVLHPSMRELAGQRAQREERLTTSSAIMLGAAVLATPVADILMEQGGRESRAELIAVSALGLIVAVLVMVRLGTLIRHGQRLARRLTDALDQRDRELAQSESRYRALVEQLPGVIFHLREPSPGARPVPVYVSPQSTAILGIDAADVLATPSLLQDSVHPDDAAYFLASRNTLTEEGESVETEFRIVRPDGKVVWLRGVETAIRGNDGLVSVQGILVDVTEGKNAKSECERMELDLRLAQRHESVGQLAAGIAHEINTPIQFVGDTVRFLDDAFGDVTTLVDQYRRLHEAARRHTVDAELLQEIADAEEHADLEYLTERVPQAFERAVDGIGRIAGIVGAMRAFAHPPATEKTAVDINEALRNTLVVAANEYKYTADLDTQFGDLPPVVCDAGDMNQVFLNVVVNAAHAIQDVVGDSGERGTLTVATRVDGAEAVVSIGDTGPGIAKHVVGRVFDPFFTTKEIGRGTGQGLALVRSIVADKHAGRVTVQTAAGEGTTFEIRLPLGEPDTVDAELAA
jgi:PAS domain S-box-containing protein